MGKYDDADVEKIVNKIKVSKKKILGSVFLGIIIIIALSLAGQIAETVQKGTYHVIQRPFTGNMRAIMEPGMYWQLFSDVQAWPTSETFYFTADKKEGKYDDQSIEVTFNDGSVARISGTTRVVLPKSEKEAIKITRDMNFKDYIDLEHRFILPIVRNSLRLTANLMTARESYSEKMSDYVAWARDMIEHGLYKTEEREAWVEDPRTKEKTLKRVKVIMKDDKGHPLREANPLEGTGITLVNFEIKKFVYEDVVTKQIAEQQKQYMEIETAKAQAMKAEQEAKTKESQGKAAVMEVRYNQLKIKEQATIEADQQKQVAETNAAKQLEVAKLEKQAAEFTKQRDILLGQGESEKKRLILEADGALDPKLKTIKEINQVWAEAYASRKVPQFYTESGDSKAGGGPDSQFMMFMNLLNIKAAKDLSLDLGLTGDTGIREKTTTPQKGK
jgi:regulator of protease activity HflC (stomatin/prohibitin superfamily)